MPKRRNLCNKYLQLQVKLSDAFNQMNDWYLSPTRPLGLRTQAFHSDVNVHKDTRVRFVSTT